MSDLESQTKTPHRPPLFARASAPPSPLASHLAWPHCRQLRRAEPEHEGRDAAEERAPRGGERLDAEPHAEELPEVAGYKGKLGEMYSG